MAGMGKESQFRGTVLRLEAGCFDFRLWLLASFEVQGAHARFDPDSRRALDPGQLSPVSAGLTPNS